MLSLLWIPIGLLIANGIEWSFHRYILHGLGKRKSSWWAFHWHNHHRNARQNGFRDDDYLAKPWDTKAMGREALALVIGGGLATLIFCQVSWVLTLTLWHSAWNYYRVHKKSHMDPEWAKRHLAWHWDHHMGKNQNANWCVTKPWFDWIMGTRIHYPETRQ